MTFLDENELSLTKRSIVRVMHDKERVKMLMGPRWHEKMSRFIGVIGVVWYYNRDKWPVVMFQDYQQTAVTPEALTRVTSGNVQPRHYAYSTFACSAVESKNG